VGIGRWLELAEIEGQLARGDRFLLSSDGLHGALPHDVLAGLVATPELEAAADGLIAAALRAGAPDNVSLILVDVAGGPALRAPG
jgi:serine/threonine protein phosphatase PrpC